MSTRSADDGLLQLLIDCAESDREPFADPSDYRLYETSFNNVFSERVFEEDPLSVRVEVRDTAGEADRSLVAKLLAIQVLPDGRVLARIVRTLFLGFWHRLHRYFEGKRPARGRPEAGKHAKRENGQNGTTSEERTYEQGEIIS